MKTIVILSPDAWGIMKVSKMHFAIELANRGHKVFFVNPPRSLADGQRCLAERVPGTGQLSVIHLNDNRFRISLREKLLPLYKIVESGFIRCVKKISGPIDELWNFNPHVFINPNKFYSKRNLLFVYDRFTGRGIHHAAQNSDMIFSVAENILRQFEHVPKKKVLLNHALAPAFVMRNGYQVTGGTNLKTKVGYVGNLFRQGIDKKVFLKIIEDHPDMEFHIWGPSSFEKNNLSSHDAPVGTKVFIESLNQQSHVMMHGIVPVEQLAEEIQAMDAFLFVYNPATDINQASNAHKLMEYLSTGKAVIAMHVSRFAENNLLVMDKADGGNFPRFFSEAVNNLDIHNASAEQDRRRNFALSNTYKHLADEIGRHAAEREVLS